MAYARTHGGWAREALDKVFLAGSFLVGLVGTIALKVIAAPVILVALFPVGVLVLYVLLCLKIRSIGTEPETIGDNSYYLGFLFTLASLAVTLFKIRDISAGDADLIPLVISGFGVALSSTIAGVFLRVLMLQMKVDITIRERQARQELNDGARELRESLAHASRTLKEISVETAQHVSERNNKMAEVMDAYLQRSLEILETQASAHDETMKEFARRLNQEVVTVMRTESEASIAEITKAATGFRESMEAIVKTRASQESALCASVDSFRKTVDAAGEAIVKHKQTSQQGHEDFASHSRAISQTLTEASDSVQKSVSLSRLVIEEAQKAAGAARDRSQKDEQQIRMHVAGVSVALQAFETTLAQKTAEVEKFKLPAAAAARVAQVTTMAPSAGADAAQDQPPRATSAAAGSS